MKTIEVTDSRNPVFNSVTGLSNITYDNSNIRSGQMATEDQIRQLNLAADDLQARVNSCCRDLCMWKTYLRIVDESSGVVVSDFYNNVVVGYARRGEPFTVEFARVLDFNKFSDERGGSNKISENSRWGSAINCNSFDDDGTKIEDAMTVMLNDAYEDSTSVSVGNPQWPCILPYPPGPCSNKARISIVGMRDTTGAPYMLKNLPRTRNVRDNFYRIYKDENDGKLKIDVMGKNQFGNATNTIYGFYKTVFVTQWVLKTGATL